MQHTFTLPYLRTSPIHVPRRDLVLSSADSLLLTVAVVEADNSCAQALVLDTDVNGPSMQLVLWRDTANQGGWYNNQLWYGYDYQRQYPPGVAILQSVIGTPGCTLGSWDFFLPTNTFANFPRRCGWAILLLWNDGSKSSVLGQGIVNFMRPFFTGVPLVSIPPPDPIPIVPPGSPSYFGLMTDDLRPILTSDTLQRLETS